MLAPFPKVPKTQRPKAMKIDVFDYHTLVWRPLSREPLRISAQTLCRQKLESVAYIFAADSMGLFSFNFFVVGCERCIFYGTECVSAVQGHPRSLILALGSSQSSPTDSFRDKKNSSRNSKGFTPSEGVKWEWGRKNSQFSANNSPYFRNGAR